MSEVMHNPFLNVSGAVEAGGPDAGVASHYGEPVAEQRRLLDGGAVVDFSHRSVLTVTGSDRLSWLNDVTSQDFARVNRDQWYDAMVLGPQGRIQYSFSAYEDGECVWIHTEYGHDLMEFLSSMVFINRVELADVTDQWAVIGHARAAPDGEHAELTQRLIPRDEVDPSGSGGEQRPAGVWAWEALRIASGLPRIGLDTDEKTIPNEIGMPGVSIDKGCYPGQETVLKVHNLGRPPRRLVRLNLDGSVDRLPELGAPITKGDKTIGWVGTSARHYELGPVAIGLVKRNTDTDAELLADGVAARQEILVDPDVGLHIRPVLE